MPLEWHRHYGPCRNWDNGEADDGDGDDGDDDDDGDCDGDDNDNGEADYDESALVMVIWPCRKIIYLEWFPHGDK